MKTVARIPRRSVWSQFDNEVNRMFDGLFAPVRAYDAEGANELVPAVDISETENEYFIRAALPGINKEDVELTLENGVLTLSAETRNESEQREGERVIRQERNYGKYVRSLKLGKGVDESAVEASYTNGVLEIRIPKAEEVKPKRIEVAIQ